MDEIKAIPPPSADPPEVYQPMEGDAVADRVWIDLYDPSEADVAEAGELCGLRVPTRDNLSEIESSSRHFVENGALYLSLPLIAHAETDHPILSPVGFIVTRERLVTVRYAKAKAFDMATEQLKANPAHSGLEAFCAVIEAIIDRQADLLELLGSELEEVSHDVFHPPKRKSRDSANARALLARVGGLGNRSGKMHASLITIARLLPFIVDTSAGLLSQDLTRRLHAAKDDVQSLLGYLDNLSNKNQFVLDAALGFINIEQNDVFKILTVVSVVGVPPTLVASIYGMNFKAMPELNWAYGYPYALCLIVLTTVIPLWWFRRKSWF